MTSSAFIGREVELNALVDALRHPGSVAELVAWPGTGKTSLLKKLATDNGGVFGGAVEYFVGCRDFPLTAAVDTLAASLGAASGHSLLIIDAAEELDAGDILEAINRLSTGSWTFSTVVATRRELGVGSRIDLQAFGRDAFAALLRRMFDGKLDAEGMEKLWGATRGNPAVARLLADHWRSGRLPDVSALAALLEPWTSSGLVGPDGRPLRSGGMGEQRIISDVREISDALLRQIAEEPRLVYDMSPHRFEELVAELLEQSGYAVTLTPRTRDGGKDIYAAKNEALGSFLYIVECKRYAPHRPVEVGVIRALYGVAQHERINAAMVMTTSYFSRPAREFAEELKYQISLKDYFDLRGWLDRYRGRS